MNTISKLQTIKIAREQRNKANKLNSLQIWFKNQYGMKKNWKTEVAKKLGVTMPTFYNLFNGDTPLKVEQVIILSELTGLSYKELIEGEQDG